MGLFSNLLPSRNGLFALRLEIKDLANVPLVAGAFGTEWRFRKTKAGLKPSPADSKGKGKGQDAQQQEQQGRRRRGGDQRRKSTVSLRPTVSRRSSTTLSRSTSTTTTSSSTSTSLLSSGASSSASSSSRSVNGSSRRKRSHRPHRSDLLQAHAGTSNSVRSGQAAGAVSTKGRGETAVAEIVDHACKWEQTVVGNVRIPVVGHQGSEEGARLGDRELWLSVNQYHSAEDLDRILRLGQLTLNLAEYAGRGPIVRRYLLESGKTNATLKLEIELTQIGGQRHWSAPPISKGQLAYGGLETLVQAGSSTPVSSGAAGGSEGGPSIHPASAASSKSYGGPGDSTTTTMTGSSLSKSNSGRAGRKDDMTPTTSAGLDDPPPSSSSGQAEAAAAKAAGSSPPAASSSTPTPPAIKPLPPRTHQQGQKHKQRQQQPSLANVDVNEPRRSQGFIRPTGTEAVIEALFNPFPSSVPGPFTFTPPLSALAAARRKPTSNLSFVDRPPSSSTTDAIAAAADDDNSDDNDDGGGGSSGSGANDSTRADGNSGHGGRSSAVVGKLGRRWRQASSSSLPPPTTTTGDGQRPTQTQRRERERHAEQATATEMRI